MPSLRCKGEKNGLGKEPEQAKERARQLKAIDPGLNCPWPLDWQRHYRVLADLVDPDGSRPAIEPGVFFEGDDLGKWLERQKQPGTWTQLLPEQQERLTTMGMEPVQAPSPTPASRSTPKAHPSRSKRSCGA